MSPSESEGGTFGSRGRTRRTAPSPLRPLRRGLLLTPLLLLGCASLPSPAPLDVDAGGRIWTGRFAVSQQLTEADGRARQEAASGRFRLQMRPVAGGETLDLELSSPFGQILASGQRAADGRAQLRLADGRLRTADSLDALLAEALGAALPIERLPDWLADRYETVLARSPEGMVQRAQDSGWQIERAARRWVLQHPYGGAPVRAVLVLDR